MPGHVYAPDRELSEEDRAAIDATCRDYVAGWYTGDVARMDRCLHPDLDKRGLVRRVLDTRADLILPGVTTKDMMLAFTREGVGLTDEPERMCEVTILSAEHHLASVRVDLKGMTDLLHLIRFPEGWKIVQSIWCLDGGSIATVTSDV